METSISSAGFAEPASAAGDLTNHKHHNSSKLYNHHANIASTSILIIIICTISVIVLFAIFLIIFMLTRLKHGKSRNSSKDNGSIHNTSSRFISHTTINLTSSPDVKGGCLYGGNMGQKPQRKSSVQVFTYKDLEAATDEFSEANVIGNGGYGVVYRGILNDGTVAAIKMLHREGKQGERAFRMEASHFISFWLHYPFLFVFDIFSNALKTQLRSFVLICQATYLLKYKWEVVSYEKNI